MEVIVDTNEKYGDYLGFDDGGDDAEIFYTDNRGIKIGRVNPFSHFETSPQFHYYRSYLFGGFVGLNSK